LIEWHDRDGLLAQQNCLANAMHTIYHPAFLIEDYRVLQVTFVAYVRMLNSA